MKQNNFRLTDASAERHTEGNDATESFHSIRQTNQKPGPATNRTPSVELVS